MSRGNQTLQDAENAVIAQTTPTRAKNVRTVSFGDASSVKSLPVFTVIALVAIFLGWWLSTRIWGMTPGFSEEFFAVEEGASEKLLIAGCNRDDACEFSQFISPQAFPSVADTWRATVRLFTEGFQNRTIWEQIWASLWRCLLYTSDAADE